MDAKFVHRLIRLALCESRQHIEAKPNFDVVRVQIFESETTAGDVQAIGVGAQSYRRHYTLPSLLDAHEAYKHHRLGLLTSLDLLGPRTERQLAPGRASATTAV